MSEQGRKGRRTEEGKKDTYSLSIQQLCCSKEGLMLEESASKFFTVANFTL